MYNYYCNNLQWLHDVHMIVRFMVTIVLFPDPTLEEGKGSGELGPSGPALRNFHAPIRSQLWAQSHD